MNSFTPENFATELDQGAASVEAQAKLEAGKTHATQAAQELKDAAVCKARQVKDATLEFVGDARKRVEGSVSDARHACEDKTRENPVKCLLMAFGAGLLLGILVRN